MLNHILCSKWESMNTKKNMLYAYPILQSGFKRVLVIIFYSKSWSYDWSCSCMIVSFLIVYRCLHKPHFHPYTYVICQFLILFYNGLYERNVYKIHKLQRIYYTYYQEILLLYILPLWWHQKPWMPIGVFEFKMIGKPFLARDKRNVFWFVQSVQ